MRTLMKCVDNGHFKQYEVTMTPLPGGTTQMTTSYGRIGGNQTVNNAVFEDTKAYSEYQKLVTSKVRKGYVVVEQQEADGRILQYEDPTAEAVKAQNRVYVKAPDVDGAELEAMLDDVLDGLSL